MNKEEFQTKKNDIDSKIRELKNQKRNSWKRNTLNPTKDFLLEARSV